MLSIKKRPAVESISEKNLNEKQRAVLVDNVLN